MSKAGFVRRECLCGHADSMHPRGNCRWCSCTEFVLKTGEGTIETASPASAVVPLDPVEAFYRRVNARAEADILNGRPVTGAHHRALEAEITTYRTSPVSTVVPEDLRAENKRLREAIYWALGERDEFAEEPPPLKGKWRRRFWWRTELRQRAFGESALAARAPQREAQLCSRTVVAWLRAYASQFIVHSLIHGDIKRVADHIEARAPQREGGQ